MNLLLIEPGEIGPDRRVRLTGRRARHLVRVLRVEPGRTLRAGVLGEGLGGAEVLAVSGEAGRRAGTGPASEETVELRLDACEEVPPPPPADLILALPRPKALRRILRLVAAVGVGRLDLVNAWRVERSYFASPVLEPAAIRRELVLGAEQGGVPRLPEVRVRRYFVPFLEGLERSAAGPAAEGSRREGSAAAADELHRDTAEPEEPDRDRPEPGAQPPGPGRTDRRRIVAHPGAETALEEVAAGAGRSPEPPLLALGPEGGWIDEELDSFRAAGFRRASLGPWTLTTEHAVAVALGQLALLGRRPAGRT